MDKILKAGILKSYKRLSDKSVNVTVNLNECSPHDILTLDQTQDNYGIFYFRGDEALNQQEIDELDNIELDLYDEPKSMSQRLINVFFVLWKSQGELGEFKDFYKLQMERLINHFKDKLPNE